MSREARPREESKIAAAGPLATLGCVLVCLAADLAIVGPHRLLEAISLNGEIRITPVLLSLSWLLPINVLILCFNLVPAFPLDGGRIARAIIWRTTGDKVRGTRVSARLGEGFAVLLAAAGAWMVLTTGAFGGFWLLASRSCSANPPAARCSRRHVSERIEGSGCRTSWTISLSRSPLRRSSPTRSMPTSAATAPPGCRSSTVVGTSSGSPGVSASRKPQTARKPAYVGSALASDDAATLRIDENGPLTELLSLESLGRLGAVMAVDREGVLRGVVTVEQVRRALHSVLGSPTAR